MGEARHSRVKVHLAAYASECLRSYAQSQGKNDGDVFGEWIVADLADQVDQLISSGGSLPLVATEQELVTLRVTAAARSRLNEQAARLAVVMADESVSARRLGRWLIEKQLQSLGEL